MPLIGFRPTQARLVIENTRDNVFVMKVVLDADDAVELPGGMMLGDLQGSLRIRERRRDTVNVDKTIGTLVYVSPENAVTSAKFQVDVSMAAEKFAVLLRTASTGRLPVKFFVDAVPGAGPGIAYRVRDQGRTKFWDTHAQRSLPIGNFVMILPIDVSMSSAGSASVSREALSHGDRGMAELADEMLVFQSDTRNTMFGLVGVLAVIGITSLVLSLAIFFR